MTSQSGSHLIICSLLVVVIFGRQAPNLHPIRVAHEKIVFISVALDKYPESICTSLSLLESIWFSLRIKLTSFWFLTSDNDIPNYLKHIPKWLQRHRNHTESIHLAVPQIPMNRFLARPTDRNIFRFINLDLVAVPIINIAFCSPMDWIAAENLWIESRIDASK